MHLSLIPFLLLFTALALSIHAEAAEKPNILLLLVDDLKPALGCYGDRHARTPNIDALAARGMRFDLAYCNQAVCAPSRFTLMLGSHSTSTGLYGLGSHLRQAIPDAVTLPQQDGYGRTPQENPRPTSEPRGQRKVESNGSEKRNSMFYIFYAAQYPFYDIIHRNSNAHASRWRLKVTTI